MQTYTAPLDDIRFVMRELLAPEHADAQRLPGMADFSDDVMDAVLEEAAKLNHELLLPLNRVGDEQGCQYENGEVRTPPGFKEAYRQFAEGGWTGLCADPDYGGQAAPNRLAMAVEEINCGSNLAFSMYSSLSHGVYNALEIWASDELKATFLPKLTDGTWSGTMCLTEPQSGTDLGLIKTRAQPMDNGRYRITGNKIFISAGEHDLTENILHLVLARTPDAPAGIKGISLFLVPKFALNDDGTVGPRNGVRCGSIESKMGLHGSPTCVLNFDDAEGYLVGILHKGMRAMFTMMNAARLEVGLQGMTQGEAAYQGAVAYARERLQGRALKGPASPDQPADSILVHADVRRMLLEMRCRNEGGRALVAWVAHYLDIAKYHEDPVMRQQADDLVSLLTPVVKAALTDAGSEVANLAVQVLGGHGYIREQGIEQYVRDARICQIYEGTNGVQALDLVGRKLAVHMGRYLRPFFHTLAAYLEDAQARPRPEIPIAQLAKAFGRLQKATGFIAQGGLKDPDLAAAVAKDYLELFALVAQAYLWCRASEAAQADSGKLPAVFYRAKLATAGYFFERILPRSSSLFAAIMSGGDTVMGFPDEAF